MIKLISTRKDLISMVRSLPKKFMVDSETQGLWFLKDKVTMIQIGVHKGDQYIIDPRKLHKDIGPILGPVMRDPSYIKVLHNAFFDGCFFAREFDIWIRGIRDTMLQARVLLGNTFDSASLTAEVERRLGIDLPKEDVELFLQMDYNDEYSNDMMKYGANDVKHLVSLDDAQRKEASEDDLKIMDLENQTVEVTIYMRTMGISFDTAKWKGIAKESKKLYDNQEKKLNRLAKANVLWTSERQVKKYFSENHDIEIESYKFLPRINKKEKNKVLQAFVDLRDLYQDVNLFGEKWLMTKVNRKGKARYEPTVTDGKVHANFNQILETGRFSCQQPNLQQLRSESDHRECFIASKGHLFGIADYSNQELAIAAVASGERRWIDTIKKGGDIHGEMAARLWGPNYTVHHRLIAKRINFAILYGSGAATVAASTGLDEAVAKTIIYKWRRAVPTLSKWLYDQVDKAERTLESYSLYGRRRDLKYVQGRTYTIAQNNPIQATGADIIKLAMCMAYKAGLSVVLCVHDELIIEAPRTRIAQDTKKLGILMEKAATEVLGIPLIKAVPKICSVWEKKKDSKKSLLDR